MWECSRNGLLQHWIFGEQGNHIKVALLPLSVKSDHNNSMWHHTLLPKGLSGSQSTAVLDLSFENVLL